MSETPRVKRLFQPSINQYFQRVTDENAPPTAEHQSRHSVPVSIQSSLLSVGMRIRRAVPGGYQSSKPSTAQSGNRWPMSPIEGNTRELQPFCGLHKVGGFLEPQPPSVKIDPFADEDGWPPSSIESTASTVSTASQPAALSRSQQQSRKRSIDDESDQEQENDMHVEPSLQASAPRPFARPRRLRSQRPVAPIPMDLGPDFEEASFLMPPE